MIVTTRDPVTGTDIQDPENHPYVVEGDGPGALKMYFESEATKQAYLEADTHNPWDDDFLDY